MGRRRQGARPVGSGGSGGSGSGEGRARAVLTSIPGGAGAPDADARDDHDRAEAPEHAGRVQPGSSAAEIGQRARIWHVVLNVAGRVTPLPQLKQGLEQLAHEHPPFLTARYAADHAEIRYWEQADDLQDAAALALRLWGEHRVSAQLPPWEVVGLEVVDRPTYHKRIAEGYGEPPAFLGGVHPY
ncbi:hypothetical protein [Streptacidiphilus sp. MAP5-3]|uniref:hypothetical protein n=1 Tax=unclassified Streptacidiphilus TaxID=2643834 RepID=UPI003516CBBF